MKKLSLYFLVWIVLLITVVGAGLAENPQITVLTYNIRHCEGNDGKIDLERIAKIINSVTPDLVALQEVDVKTARSNGVDQSEALGKMTGMIPCYAPAIPYKGGEYGIATLVRESRLGNLPYSSKDLPYSNGREKRVVNERILEWKDTLAKPIPFRFCCTHLDYLNDENDRLPQAKTINEWVCKETNRQYDNKEIQIDVKTPAILAGDMNAEPKSNTIAEFRKFWMVAGDDESILTFPSEKPDRRIDYILCYPKNRWRVVKCQVLDEPVASDHRPLLAILELLPES